MNKINRLLAKYYDDHALEWAENRTHSFWYEKPFRKFVSPLKNDSIVLDIGCSTGFIVPLFLGIGRHLRYEGIDISDEMVNIAKSRYPQLSFRKLDIVDASTLPQKKI